MCHLLVLILYKFNFSYYVLFKSNTSWKEYNKIHNNVKYAKSSIQWQNQGKQNTWPWGKPINRNRPQNNKNDATKGQESETSDYKLCM